MMPGYPFPPAGPVGLGSPPSPVLWITTTATRPSRQRSLLAPLSLPFRIPFSSTQRVGCSLTAFSVAPSGRYAVNRLRWRHVALSSSRVNPLRACPALRPRWCPVNSPSRAPNCGLLSDEKYRLSLGYAAQVMLSHHNLRSFRGSITRPARLFPPASNSPLLDCMRSSLLPCGLSFR
jgi:hypothetical protein